MAKQNRNLLFSKSTGVLIGEITAETDTSVMDLSKFDVKNVSIDDDHEYWNGDFATGQILSRLDRPVVTESSLKYATNLKVLREYSIHKQLNIVIDMLNKSSIENTPEFTAMVEFLDLMRRQHEEKKAVFSSDESTYVWVSEQEEQALIAKKTV